jgi:hypothetical protein
MKTIVTALLFIYPSLCSKMFSTFKCVAVGNTRYMVADMTQICFEGDHIFWVGWSAAGVVIYVVGIPLGMLLSLWAARRRGAMSFPVLADEPTPASVKLAGQRLDEHYRTMAAFGSLYSQCVHLPY